MAATKSTTRKAKASAKAKPKPKAKNAAKPKAKATAKSSAKANPAIPAAREPAPKPLTELKSSRPLSPHLQVYRPQMTSMLSILHRMTGVALALGTILIVYWLVAAATGPDSYATAQAFTSSPIGQLLLFGWSAALYYHLFNGVRHLIWDTGQLFDIDKAKQAGYFVLGSTIIFTMATWGCVLVYH